MPIVQIDIIEGRTEEQKRQMAKNVTQGIMDALGVPADAVSIIIRDMEKHNFAKGGVLRKDWK